MPGAKIDLVDYMFQNPFVKANINLSYDKHFVVA